MKPMLWACAAMAAAAISANAVADENDVPADAPGWTGVTHPEDVTIARQVLMVGMSRLMAPIDAYAVGAHDDPDEVRDAAATIGEMMIAFPHLFPPTTNLYDPNADLPVTAALPVIWEQFPAFYAMSAAAQTAAESLAVAAEVDAIRAGAERLRATCDGCHAVYLEQYTPPVPGDADVDFDFDAFFESVE